MTYALHSTRARCRAMPKVFSLSAGLLNVGAPPAGGTASAAAGGAAASKADKERQRKERQKQRKVAEAEAALQAALAALDRDGSIR